jgi:hypothetical protein
VFSVIRPRVAPIGSWLGVQREWRNGRVGVRRQRRLAALLGHPPARTVQLRHATGEASRTAYQAPRAASARRAHASAASPLAEVGHVLRHCSALTTAIYAQVRSRRSRGAGPAVACQRLRPHLRRRVVTGPRSFALRTGLADYLARRALGYRQARPEKLLNQFLDHLERRGEAIITVAVPLDRAQLPARTARVSQFCVALSGSAGRSDAPGCPGPDLGG